nr:hypothetical protein [Pseudomonas vanderleydeniana]
MPARFLAFAQRGVHGLFRAWQRSGYRHFALLDSRGVCIAFRSGCRRPENGRWVEVSETRLAWLGQVLPEHIVIN